MREVGTRSFDFEWDRQLLQRKYGSFCLVIGYSAPIRSLSGSASPKEKSWDLDKLLRWSSLYAFPSSLPSVY